MKIPILLPILFLVLFYSANAQDHKPRSIHTEKAVIKISKTKDGKDMITMSIACWDEIAAGTKYAACYLSELKKRFCIEIANKKYGLCRRGIGLGCSIFDCSYVPGSSPNKVNDENRICAVSVRKIENIVQLIFIDQVDWKSLE